MREGAAATATLPLSSGEEGRAEKVGKGDSLGRGRGSPTLLYPHVGGFKTSLAFYAAAMAFSLSSLSLSLSLPPSSPKGGGGSVRWKGAEEGGKGRRKVGGGGGGERSMNGLDK